MTPTRAVQTFIDAKKAGREIPADCLVALRSYKQWKEHELLAVLNASGYYPDILIEPDMEANIHKRLEWFKSRLVDHKFVT